MSNEFKTKFGFELMRQREVNLSSADAPEVIQLQVAEPSMTHCISCGSCAGTCTRAGSGVSFRKALLLIRRGLINEAYEMMESCVFCGKCRFVCPRGVNTRRVIYELYRLKKINHAI
jgi:heterodisulfide reductase subunit C